MVLNLDVVPGLGREERKGRSFLDLGVVPCPGWKGDDPGPWSGLNFRPERGRTLPGYGPNPKLGVILDLGMVPHFGQKERGVWVRDQARGERT